MYTIVYLIIFIAMFEAGLRLTRKLYQIHPDHAEDHRRAFAAGALVMALCTLLAPKLAVMLVAVG
jgi:hypothetical protein